MSDGMRRELAYLSSHATNRYFIPNWGSIYKQHASFLIYFVFIPLFFIVATFIYSKIQTAIKQEKQVYI